MDAALAGLLVQHRCAQMCSYLLFMVPSCPPGLYKALAVSASWMSTCKPRHWKPSSQKAAGGPDQQVCKYTPFCRLTKGPAPSSRHRASYQGKSSLFSCSMLASHLLVDAAAPPPWAASCLHTGGRDIQPPTTTMHYDPPPCLVSACMQGGPLQHPIGGATYTITLFPGCLSVGFLCNTRTGLCTAQGDLCQHPNGGAAQSAQSSCWAECPARAS